MRKYLQTKIDSAQGSDSFQFYIVKKVNDETMYGRLRTIGFFVKKKISSIYHFRCYNQLYLNTIKSKGEGGLINIYEQFFSVQSPRP